MLIHLRRIELAAMLKKLDQMRAHYHRQLKAVTDPAISEICLAIVEQHGEMVPPAESINAFQEVMRRHGPSAAAFYGIGYSMEQQGNHERAIYNYQQALGADPGWIVAYFGLSQVYPNRGREAGRPLLLPLRASGAV